MITPEQIDEAPDRIERIFQHLEDYIIADLADKLLVACNVTSTMEWLIIRAELMGMARANIYAKLAEAINESEEVVYEIFDEIALSSALNDVERFAEGGLKAEQIAQNDFLKPIIDAVYENTCGTFENLGNSTGMMFNREFVQFDEFYTRQLDEAQMAVMTGVKTYDEAVTDALVQASEKGVQVIDYESGYTQNVTSASRTITRTGINQIATEMNEQICEELDLDLVEVTAHGGARPTHKVWQGKVFSRKGSTEKYPNLEEATGLGTVTGLCGANCRHSYYGYVEGAPRAYTQEQLDNIDPPPFEYNGKTYDIYKATQHMRYMERQMRKTQRQIAGFESAGLDEKATALKIKLKRQRAEYKKFAKVANIRPRLDKAKYVKGT